MLGNKAHRNWIKSTQGLSHLHDGLVPFVDTESKEQYRIFLQGICNKCNIRQYDCSQCKIVGNKKRISCPRNGSCGELWDLILSHHMTASPDFRNGDSTKWSESYVEVAKCFIYGTGYSNVRTMDGLDCSALLTICINNKDIWIKLQTSGAVFKQARKNRNTILHSPVLEVSDQELKGYLQVMVGVLNATVDRLNMRSADTSITTEAIAKIRELETGDIYLTPTHQFTAAQIALRELQTNEKHSENYHQLIGICQHVSFEMRSLNQKIDEMENTLNRRDSAIEKKLDEILTYVKTAPFNTTQVEARMSLINNGGHDNRGENDVSAIVQEASVSLNVEQSGAIVQPNNGGFIMVRLRALLRNVFHFLGSLGIRIMSVTSGSVLFRLRCDTIEAFIDLVRLIISGELTELFEPTRFEIQHHLGLTNLEMGVVMYRHDFFASCDEIESKVKKTSTKSPISPDAGHIKHLSNFTEKIATFFQGNKLNVVMDHTEYKDPVEAISRVAGYKKDQGIYFREKLVELLTDRYDAFFVVATLLDCEMDPALVTADGDKTKDINELRRVYIKEKANNPTDSRNVRLILYAIATVLRIEIFVLVPRGLSLAWTYYPPLFNARLHAKLNFGDSASSEATLGFVTLAGNKECVFIITSKDTVPKKPNCTGLISFYAEMARGEKDEKEKLHTLKDLDDNLLILREFVQEFFAKPLELNQRRKLVNTAVIATSSTGIIGGVAAFVGVALSPITFGGSLALTAAGVAVTVGSGAVAAGMRIHEAGEHKKAIEKINERQKDIADAEAHIATDIRATEVLFVLNKHSVCSLQSSSGISSTGFKSILNLVKSLHVAAIALTDTKGARVGAAKHFAAAASVGGVISLMSKAAVSKAKGDQTDLSKVIECVVASQLVLLVEYRGNMDSRRILN